MFAKRQMWAKLVLAGIAIAAVHLVFNSVYIGVWLWQDAIVTEHHINAQNSDMIPVYLIMAARAAVYVAVASYFWRQVRRDEPGVVLALTLALCGAGCVLTNRAITSFAYGDTTPLPVAEVHWMGPPSYVMEAVLLGIAVVSAVLVWSRRDKAVSPALAAM